MTIKEAQAKVNQITKEVAQAAMNKDWARAKALNEQANLIQKEIYHQLYGRG